MNKQLKLWQIYDRARQDADLRRGQVSSYSGRGPLSEDVMGGCSCLSFIFPLRWPLSLHGIITLISEQVSSGQT
jgi:hypothetical protein